MKRQDDRKAALKEFKEKTQNVLKTFDVKLPDVKEVRKPSLLQQYTIDIGIHNIGVALPLDPVLPLQWPTSTNLGSTPVRAFLLSIQSIRFSTHRGETGQATVDALALQFVHRLVFAGRGKARHLIPMITGSDKPSQLISVPRTIGKTIGCTTQACRRNFVPRRQSTLDSCGSTLTLAASSLTSTQAYLTSSFP